MLHLTVGKTDSERLGNLLNVIQPQIAEPACNPDSWFQNPSGPFLRCAAHLAQGLRIRKTF